MADKLIALPATRNYVHHRDIWDLVWLQQQNAKLDTDLVKKKIADYKLTNFTPLKQCRQSLPEVITGQAFMAEMERFLPNDVFTRTLGNGKFIPYLISSLEELFKKLQLSLSNNNDQPEFWM